MRGQKGQMHPAFNFKVCVMMKDCEEEGDGQPVNPEPEAKAAERAALLPHLYSQQTNTSQWTQNPKSVQNTDCLQ